MTTPEKDLGKSIQDAEFKNILKKLRDGKTLTARESKLAYERAGNTAKKEETQSVTAEQLAELFDLSKVRIHQLLTEGIVKKFERGRFDLLESVRGYVGFLKRRKTNQYDSDEDDGNNYGKHRSRLTKSKADIAEMQAEAMKGTFHEAAAVEAVWTDMLMNCRSKLMAMPTRLAPKLRQESELAVVQDILEIALTEALNELAAYDPDRITSQYIQSHREEVDATAEMDGERVGGQ